MARTLIDRGFAVCVVRPGQKQPTAAGWPTRSAGPDDFGPGDGIGIVTGWPSDGGLTGHALVCVDLDTPDAVAKADNHLPPTGMIDGRAGKPRSHRWYLVTTGTVPPDHVSTAKLAAPAAAAVGKHPGPKTTRFKGPGKKTVIDLLGTGSQAVCPPSAHDSGEPRLWDGGGEPGIPTVVDYPKLVAAVERLAEACGWVRPVGPRHKAAKRQSPRPTPTDAEGGADARGPLTVGCTTYSFAERVRRAEAYLDAVPDDDLPRAGRGGHPALFRLARVVVNDFAIRDPAAVQELLGRLNARYRRLAVARPGDGFESWSADELDHKVSEALAAPLDDPGRKLAAAPPPPMAWDDPDRLAGELLAARRIVCLRGTQFGYDGGRYVPLSADAFTAVVRRFVEGRAVDEYLRRRDTWDAANVELVRRADELRSRPQPATPPANADADRRALAADEAKHAKGKPAAKTKVGRELVATVAQAVRARSQLPDATRPGTWLDGAAQPAVLCVANGLLDTAAVELRPHSTAYFTLAALPTRFVAAAPPPERWLAFIRDVTEGDADRAAVLQEVAGACLDPNLTVKFFAVLSGGGDNGKSVFLCVLRAVLGADNCSAVPLDRLADRFGSFPLLGKLANVVGDQGYIDSRDEGWLKMLTGGDLMGFEQKGRDALEAVNTAKLVFAANTPPTFSDKSEAVWNRLVMVPFTWTVPDERKNFALLSAGFWDAERPGILNWMLDGLRRLRATGRFTRSAACEAAKAGHQRDSNPARDFLLAGYVLTTSNADRVTAADLYGRYKQWCSDTGLTHPLNMNRFGKEVRAAFPTLAGSATGWQPAGPGTPGKSVRAWVGLRTAPDPIPPTPGTPG